MLDEIRKVTKYNPFDNKYKNLGDIKEVGFNQI